ncbi:hypothetical protein PPYR_08970 [Photinus pyralis]|uniref:Right handed beta helix domain-containing protein n=1 Tax=Photinus pyralis TaxID=7054 RepID=A0A1Y1KQM3_PHOPY|nr:uncharacterized protein LOC116171875 [Photinus pyralis]KAB0797977.1 hypothetical protein PPYR_08970 [Photinus pyralis]
MVVPIPSDGKSRQPRAKSKQYVGNDLVINLQENNAGITVIGNECRIHIGVNNGRLKVVGNSCRVDVSGGDGEITYNGNDGRIKLGPLMDVDRVTYFGNCGRIAKGGATIACAKPEDGSAQGNRDWLNRGSGKCFHVDSQKHKHFSSGLSTYSLGIPGVVMSTQILQSVRKRR